MPELYLRLLDRIMTPILLIVALVFLLRGHNLPGGGFIAGLLVASAFQLQILSRGDTTVRQRIGPHLRTLTGLGLSLAVLAAILGLVRGTFFEGVWWKSSLGALHLEASTPLLFDIGVFLVVLSFVTSFLLGLSDRDE